MHYNGVGVAKDNKTARAYFEKGVALVRFPHVFFFLVRRQELTFFFF